VVFNNEAPSTTPLFLQDVPQHKPISIPELKNEEQVGPHTPPPRSWVAKAQVRRYVSRFAPPPVDTNNDINDEEDDDESEEEYDGDGDGGNEVVVKKDSDDEEDEEEEDESQDDEHKPLLQENHIIIAELNEVKAQLQTEVDRAADASAKLASSSEKLEKENSTLVNLLLTMKNLLNLFCRVSSS